MPLPHPSQPTSSYSQTPAAGINSDRGNVLQVQSQTLEQIIDSLSPATVLPKFLKDISEVSEKSNHDANSLIELLGLANEEIDISPFDILGKALATVPLALSLFGLIYVGKSAHLIESNQLGLGTDNGNPFIMGPGWHYLLSPLRSFQNVIPMDTPCIMHGSITIVTVPKGKLCLATYNGIPKILSPGRKVYNDPLFKVVTHNDSPVFVDINPSPDSPISHGTITIARVNKGQIGKAWHNGKPIFLKPSENLYIIDDPNFKMDKQPVVNATQSYIQHGHLLIVRVDKGQLALSYDNDGHASLLSPGLHSFAEPGVTVLPTKTYPNGTFEFTVDATQKEVKIGPFTIVTVNQNEWGICFEDGTFKPLEAGRYVFEAPKQRFTGVLSKQEIVTPLSKIHVVSKDNVPLEISADLMYRIDDVNLAINKVNQIEEALKNYAESTLANIILNTTVNRFGVSIPKPATSDNQDPVLSTLEKFATPPSSQAFSEQVHDLFLAKLGEHLKQWGVGYVNIQIENIEIKDKTLQEELSAQAVTNAKQAAATFNAKSQAEVTRITAEAARNKAMQEADGQAYGITKNAEAHAQAIIVVAKAQVEAALLRQRDQSGVTQDLARMEGMGNALGKANATIVTSPDEFSRFITLVKSGGKPIFFPYPRPADPTSAPAAGAPLQQAHAMVDEAAHLAGAAHAMKAYM